MTTYKGIAAVTQTLGYLAASAIRQAVPEARVTHDRPEEPAAGSAREPRLNIYLVQVVPDPGRRSHDLPTRTSPNGALAHAPQAPVNLRYLLTFFGASQQAQLMLGAMEIALRERPILDPTLIGQALLNHPELADSGLATQQPPVRIIPTTTTLEELSRFWSGFLQTPYTVSTVYEATTVMLTSSSTAQATLPTAGVGGTRSTQPAPTLGALPTVQAGDEGTVVPVSGRGIAAGQEATLAGRSFPVVAGAGGLQFVVPPDAPVPAGTQPVTVAGSAPQPLTIRPQLLRARADNPATTVSVTVAPPVQAGQTAVLSLVALQPDESGGLPSTTVPQAVATTDDHLRFAVPDSLPAGRYLALIEVDGVTSLPTAVRGRYARPSLELHR
ncbi:MAG TPA: DUF4255 domain-containing protein [Solirubrobacteraceae bacterium]|nr:DUF4255 domain-containing protein [Solirubrobacteraceae bacterium]